MEKFKINEYVKHKEDNRRGRIVEIISDYYLIENGTNKYLFPEHVVELDLETKKLQLL